MTTELVCHFHIFSIYAVTRPGTGLPFLAAMYIKNSETGQVVHSTPLHASGLECRWQVIQWAVELGQLWCEEHSSSAQQSSAA